MKKYNVDKGIYDEKLNDYVPRETLKEFNTLEEAKAFFDNEPIIVGKECLFIDEATFNKNGILKNSEYIMTKK
jgi:hypothetical protein